MISLLDSIFKPRSHRILSALCQAESRDGSLHVLQIGANDDLIADPVTPLLKKHSSIRATRVEPINEYYEKLVSNCSSAHYSNRVKCIHSAISDHDGLGEMILPPQTQTWDHSSQGLARLKGVSVSTGRDESSWRSVTVQSMTPATLLKHALTPEVDVYVSDCEGYDVDLLALMPLKEMKARIIYMELISEAFPSPAASGQKMGMLWELLGNNGFNASVWDGFNLIAWKSPPSWSSHRPRLLDKNLVK